MITASKIDCPEAKAVWSSGVPFFPPSDKYWRIGGKWYDLTPFLDMHPGGKEVLLLCRDRFEDCTYVFESHHHNYHRARAVIRKFEVGSEKAA
jgi:cytochrome b involved in lipid metabolism